MRYLKKYKLFENHQLKDIEDDILDILIDLEDKHFDISVFDNRSSIVVDIFNYSSPLLTDKIDEYDITFSDVYDSLTHLVSYMESVGYTYKASGIWPRKDDQFFGINMEFVK